MPVDEYFYRLLGVKSTATDIDLKRAYRRQAVIHHPDKNPDDPEASVRFQAIAEAYYVLSDPNLRKIYDSHGRDGIKADSSVDPVALFSKMFGGESFKSWVGELSLLKNIVEKQEVEARMKAKADDELSDLISFTPRPEKLLEETGRTAQAQARTASGKYDALDDWKQRQRQRLAAKAKEAREEQMRRFEEAKRVEKQRRTEELARGLVQRLSALPVSPTQHELDDFVEDIRRHREALKLESFGIAILHTIAEVYESRARVAQEYWSWLGLCGLVQSSRDMFAFFGDAFATFRAADEAKTAMDMTKLGAADEVPRRDQMGQGGIDEELEKLVAGKLLSLAWHATRLEIRAVLKNVCDEALYEDGISSAQKKHRAIAMLKIAEVFGHARKDSGDACIDETFELLVANASKVTAASLQERARAGGGDKQQGGKGSAP